MDSDSSNSSSSSRSSSNDDELDAILPLLNATIVSMEEEEEEEAAYMSDEELFAEFEELRRQHRYDHTRNPRSPRRKYPHEEMQQKLQSQWLAENSFYNGSDFKAKFRISRPRFQKIMEDVGALQKHFYSGAVSLNREEVASFEARLLLPIECLAYGISMQAKASDYGMSAHQARMCCKEFDDVMGELYEPEYLRTPTAEDLYNIDAYHQRRLGVPGVLGFLDCCHSRWNKCPKSQHGSYKGGKEKHATVVLEGVSDKNFWFWHASYGYAGAMNDINILRRSPLKNSWIDGTFAALEQASQVVPFQINHEIFHKMFLLVDGIYPRFARFVKGLSAPTTQGEKAFTSWQESTRKGVETSFGNLESMWKFFSHPILLYELENIGHRVRTCLILHNMCVSDRIMDGDVDARYNPNNWNADDDNEHGGNANNNNPHAAGANDNDGLVIGVAQMQPQMAANIIAANWADLISDDEFFRLQTALINRFST